MSTSYYMACEKCQECYWVGQDGWKFFTFYSGEPRCMSGIGDFLGKHLLCGGGGPRLMSEHRVDDFKEIDWPKPPPPTG
jgi:hypothetical protein